MAATKEKKNTTSVRERSAISTVGEFEARYLPPSARARKGSAGGESQIGLGLVNHVLRDFRRSLRD